MGLVRNALQLALKQASSIARITSSTSSHLLFTFILSYSFIVSFASVTLYCIRVCIDRESSWICSFVCGKKRNTDVFKTVLSDARNLSPYKCVCGIFRFRIKQNFFWNFWLLGYLLIVFGDGPVHHGWKGCQAGVWQPSKLQRARSTFEGFQPQAYIPNIQTIIIHPP